LRLCHRAVCFFWPCVLRILFVETHCWDDGRKGYSSTSKGKEYYWKQTKPMAALHYCWRKQPCFIWFSEVRTLKKWKYLGCTLWLFYVAQVCVAVALQICKLSCSVRISTGTPSYRDWGVSWFSSVPDECQNNTSKSPTASLQILCISFASLCHLTLWSIIWDTDSVVK
jgi:hypothetical protein